MTPEEKSQKIIEFCENLNRDDNLHCTDCPLYNSPDNSCYGDDADIDRNYEILFGAEAEAEAEDMVNQPSHYTAGSIECIEAIAASMTPDEYAGFLKGQVIKYVWRYRLKGKPAEDLKKARFYLDRLIQIVDEEVSGNA